MRPPRFWDNPPEQPGWPARLLTPLGSLYGQLTARRLATVVAQCVSIPVICVGNLNIGGVGKTPTVIWLAQYLHNAGHVPHVITKGYRGSLVGPVRVKADSHTDSQVGDESLLISRFCEVWVSTDRFAAAREAHFAGATVIILDDGHQDPSLAKNFSIVVVDGTRGFGNQRCLPAGPLREPITVGLNRADVIMIVEDPISQSLPTEFSHLPTFHAKMSPLETGMKWNNARVFAFAGIGYPEKFFTTLQNLGAQIIKAESLNDHQSLTWPLMTRLHSEARARKAQLVTTEKDYVRLPAEFRSNVVALPVRLLVAEEERFFATLFEKLPSLNSR